MAGLRTRRQHGALSGGLLPTRTRGNPTGQQRGATGDASKAELATWRQAHIGETYRHEAGIAEAGAAVEPVIVAELVDLDAPLVRCLMRHGLCHHQRFGRRLGDDAAIGDEVVRWCCGVELMGRQRQVRLGRAEENEGRQCLGRLRVPVAGGKRVISELVAESRCDAAEWGRVLLLGRRVTSRKGKKSDAVGGSGEPSGVGREAHAAGRTT